MIDFNSDMKKLIEILDAREHRANKQRELLHKFPLTLISFTLNIPGSVKNSSIYYDIHKEGINHLLSVLKEMKYDIVNIETIDKITGCEGFISLDIDPVKIKKLVVNIEDTHYLGRIFNFDVFDLNYKQINRSELCLKPRKCLICDNEALKCIKMKNHSYEELISKIHDISNSYFKMMDKNKLKLLKSNISMSEKVYLKLKSDILENMLKPGEKLIEENLAKDLNVSRTPVREALKQLDQDGLITYFPRKGSIVSQISLKDAQELYEVREVLEGLSIKQICLNIDSQSLKVLEDIISSMDEAISNGEYEIMRTLHSQWTEATLSLIKNDLLKSNLIAITKKLVRLRKISLFETDQSIDAYRETKDILNAIINNDADESERLARVHVMNARKRFEKSFKN